MAVTAKMVKELREKTGAGMLDCKKALVETDGDMAQSVIVLREKGLAKAAKKAGRVAAEGLVTTKVAEDSKKAVVVEINSETDFVAKNEQFIEFVNAVSSIALDMSGNTVEDLLKASWINDDSKTVQDVLTEKIATIGEKLSLRRVEKVVTEGVIAEYIHAGGKIGVLVELATDVVNDGVKECGRNIAMQVAAIAPKYVRREEISGDYIENEKEILKSQAKNENPNKPDNIIEKMIIGRLNKGLKEICLVDQAYVKDGDLTVAKYIAAAGKEAGATLDIAKYVRFECGEGIEKKEENFAEEVARQING